MCGWRRKAGSATDRSGGRHGASSVDAKRVRRRPENRQSLFASRCGELLELERDGRVLVTQRPNDQRVRHGTERFRRIATHVPDEADSPAVCHGVWYRSLPRSPPGCRQLNLQIARQSGNSLRHGTYALLLRQPRRSLRSAPPAMIGGSMLLLLLTTTTTGLRIRASGLGSVARSSGTGSAPRQSLHRLTR